jgi:hypothetical protein
LVSLSLPLLHALKHSHSLALSLSFSRSVSLFFSFLCNL